MPHAAPFESDDLKRRALLDILRETRALLARPDNNFTWSSWADADAALREMDTLIECVANGAKPDPVQVGSLFAPTGPIQEVSLSSGWAETFLKLAERIDAVTALGK